MFVVGCLDRKLGGRALLTAFISILHCILAEQPEMLFSLNRLLFSPPPPSGGIHKQSYWEKALKRKHVRGVCESRCSSSAIQLQGDEQGLKMYHSDARQHYK